MFENLKNNVKIIKESTKKYVSELKVDGKTPFSTLTEMQNLIAGITIKSFMSDFDVEKFKVEGESL